MEATHIEAGTAILFVLQIMIGIVVMAGVPWAFSIQAKLARIDATLATLGRDVVAKKMDSSVVHDDLYSRIHKLERTIDRCPSCRDAACSIEGSEK